MYKINSIIFFLLLTTLYKSNSQEVFLSMQELVENVMENNLDLKISDENFAMKEADFLQSRAMFLPDISLHYTGISTNSPLLAFGTKLNQGIVRQEDFNPAFLNNPDPTQNFSLQLNIQQPIINLDKRHERKAAGYSMEAVTFQKERTIEHLVFQAKMWYMQLQLGYRQLEVLEQALATAISNQQIAKNSFAAGYLQKVDLLEVEIRISELENKILSAQNQIRSVSDHLHNLMHDNDFTIIRPTDKLEIITTPIPVSVLMDRPDFLAMEKAESAFAELVESHKKSNLPRLNAFGIIQTNDNDPLSSSATNYLLGLQVSWHIFDSHQRSAKIQRSTAQLAKSKLEREKYIEQTEIDFQQTIRNYREAEAKLQTIRKAIAQAEESLRIRSNRLSQGLEKTSDVLQAETKYAEQKLMESQIIFQINYAKIYAAFLSK